MQNIFSGIYIYKFYFMRQMNKNVVNMCLKDMLYWIMMKNSIYLHTFIYVLIY